MLSSFTYFQDRFIKVDNIQNFIKCEVGMYLTCLYGELIYTEEPTYNFLNVHKEGDQFVISEGLFIELFPDKPKTGTILPKAMFQVLPENQTGGKSEICKNLSEQGFHVLNLEIDESVGNTIKQKPLRPYSFDIRGCEYYFTETIFDESTSTFKDTKLYYLRDEEILLMDDVDHSITTNEVNIVNNVLKTQFADNATLNNADIIGLRLHQMTPESPPVQRHFDPSFYCKELIYLVRWVPTGDFEGREIVFEQFEHPSYDKLKDFILRLLNFCTSGQPNASDDCFKVQASIKPGKEIAILMTGFNPLFVHGVNRMLSGSGVYTLVSNIGLREYK